MNILEEIQNCSVEWKELGEVVEVLDSLRRPITKSQRIPGDIPYYGANGIQDYVKDWIFDGTFILMGEDGSVIKNDNSPILHWVTGKIWVNNHAHILGEVPGCALLKYVYYVLSQTDVSDIVRGTPPKLNQKNLKSIKIPIPPFKIQEEIVQILDKMTEYITELTSELTSRKKQYSFYRDKLLSFEDEIYQVEWKTLGDIGKVSMCRRILKNQTSDDGEIPFYKIGTFGRVATSYISRELFEDYKLRFSYPKLGDILISASGTIGRTVVFNGEDSYFQDSNIVWLDHDESQVLNRYLYYFYQINPWNVSDGGTISRLYNGNIEKTRIPVPSLEIQSRIVQVLDNFDAVCHDLNIGLPKEIELRQKQYEYFREKLLTFVAEGEYTESRVEEWDNSAIIKLLQWVFGPIRVEMGSVCEFVRGNGLQKKDFTEIGKSVIHYGQIYTKYDFTVTETLSKTSEIVFKKLKKAYPNDLVMATTSENVEDVGKAIVWEGKEEIGISGDSYIIQTSQNSRYLNYWFRSTYFQSQKERKVTGTKVVRINSKDMEKFKIVLPPITEQKRIVSILDNFNTLTSSLSEGLPKEIELRQKQYEYWRNQLLNFNE